MTIRFFPLTWLLMRSPNPNSCREDELGGNDGGAVRLPTNVIAASAFSMGTLTWFPPSHSAGNE